MLNVQAIEESRYRPILTVRALLTFAVALILITLSVSIFVAWSEIDREEQDESTQLAMLARLVEDDTHRTLDSAHDALETVAQSIAAPSNGNLLTSLDLTMGPTLVGLHGIIAISVIEASSGQIVASTTSTSIGQAVNLSLLGRLPARNDFLLGDLITGKGLPQLDISHQAACRHAFIPMMSRITSSMGQDYFAIVEIDPSILSSDQRRLLEEGDTSIKSVLASSKGDMLAASSSPTIKKQPHILNELFIEKMGSREHGTYVDDSGSDNIYAYRRSQKYSLITVVQEPRQNVIDGAIVNLKWLWYSTPLTIVIIVSLTLIANRTLRQRERAQSLLKTAQEQLRQQLQLTESIQEIAPIPLCMTDPEGVFLMVNKAWEEFMGIARCNVIGRRNADFLPPAEASIYDMHDAKLYTQDGEIHFEHAIRGTNGNLRYVQIHKVAVRRDDGVLIGLLAAKLDVTEFREAQAEAESASHSKSEFLANISHELRTPLQSILGFSELGMRRGSTQPKLHAMFMDIHASGERMLGLVNDLLDVSKIESTGGTFEFERIDIRDCLSSVLHELKPLFTRKHLNLNLIHSPQELWVNADAIRIQQVIRNVLANAIKFSPEAGLVTVATSLDQTHNEILLTVHDEGPGVPEQESKAIFEPFVQSSRTQKIGGGTGLGLAISRKILEAHDGSIDTHNANSGGAIFEIRLPFCSEENLS